MIDKGNFIDNFNDECVSFIMGIGNNININDYKSIFVSVKNNKNKDENVKDFHSFCKDKRINFKDNFGNITVSLFVGIRNNISIYIVEVPNETAPSIQGFAKPPA